jgi:hypothetical protein
MRSLNDPSTSLENLNTNTEKVFVIFSDVFRSYDHDNTLSDLISWRKVNFINQLSHFLNSRGVVVKSFGDALLIKTVFNASPSNDEVESLLSKLVKVYEEFAGNTAIKLTIHVLGNRYAHGEKIAADLQSALGEEYEHEFFPDFIKSLKADLFGSDINLAAKVQEFINKNATILVSDDVVKLLNLAPDKTRYEFKGCTLYSPVPLSYLKGISTPYIKVWELSKSGRERHILAQESKQYHIIRFLNADLDFRNLDLKNPINELIESVYVDSYHKVFTARKNEVLEFHTDITFKIQDTYRFKKIDFNRDSNLLAANMPIDNYKAFRGEMDFQNPIESLINELRILDDGAGRLDCKITPKGYKDLSNAIISFIPLLSLCSFPNQETSMRLRKLYEVEQNLNETSTVLRIEPQTIEVYQYIDITNGSYKKEDRIYLLMFFSVYRDHIDIADDRTSLFKDVSLYRAPKVCSKGILVGLVDGFVIYESSCEDLEKDITSLLNLLFAKMPENARYQSFYDYVFPISIFTLKLKDINEENVEILKKVKENYNS